MKRLIAFAHAANDPACRFRIGQYIPDLEKAGWEVSLRVRRPAYPWKTSWPGAAYACRRLRRRWDIRQAGKFNAVFLNRDLLEGKWLYESLLFERNRRVVFDFDDAIFLGEKALHIGKICQQAAWTIAGNEQLADFARRYSTRVSVIPTVIDTTRYAASPHSGGRPVRVGWMGSDQSIRETLVPHLGLLAKLQSQLAFELIVVSGSMPEFPPKSPEFRFIPWNPTVETQIAGWFDIGIMPLVDEPFQRGKCGCKLLQYMSASLPVVASPVGINRQLVDSSRGLLASSPEEWSNALAKLIADAPLRAAMGRAGRVFVEQHYSLQKWFPRWLAIIESVAAA